MSIIPPPSSKERTHQGRSCQWQGYEANPLYTFLKNLQWEKEMARGDKVLDLEQVLFVLQKRNPETREWVTQDRHVYRGKTDANIVLQRIRELPASVDEEWRAMQKQEAERYREGWNDCAEYVEATFGVEINDEEPVPSTVVPRTRSGSRSPRNTVSEAQDRER